MIFGIVMLTTGLPHGAIDHLVYQANTARQPGKRFWISFLSRYLVMMAAYTCFWLIFPQISLAIFLLLSFFHFGQSEFFYLKADEKHPLKIALYLSWGAFVLLSILHYNFSESISLIAEVITFEDQLTLFWQGYGEIVLLLLAIFTFSCLLFFLIKKSIKPAAVVVEIALLTFLIFIFNQTNLLLSFVIYFGLWHAVKAIYVEIQVLSQLKPFGFTQFAKEAIPFTLVSVIGIALLLLGSRWVAGMFSPLMLFFIVISVLTLPHMAFMATFYNKER